MSAFILIIAFALVSTSTALEPSSCAWQLSYRWEAEVGGASDWPPLVANNRVFAVHKGKGVSAVDQGTGDIVWTYDNNGVVGGCSLSLGKILVATKNSIIALDSRSGEVREQFSVPSGIPSQFGAPLIIGGLVIFGTSSGMTYAISAMNMKQVWEANVGEGNAILAAPTLWRDNVVVGTMNGHLIVLKKADGSIVSSFTTPGIGSDEGVQTGIIVSNNVAYYALSAPTTDFVAVDLQSMKLLWSVSLSVDFYAYSTPVLSNGNIFTTTFNGKVIALNPADGKIRFSLETAQEIKVRGPLAVTDSLLIVGTNSGTLVGFDASTGGRGFSFRSGAGLTSAPTVQGNSIFVAGSEFVFELETTCRTR